MEKCSLDGEFEKHAQVVVRDKAEMRTTVT
jgi:hypothetical protein